MNAVIKEMPIPNKRAIFCKVIRLVCANKEAMLLREGEHDLWDRIETAFIKNGLSQIELPSRTMRILYEGVIDLYVRTARSASHCSPNDTEVIDTLRVISQLNISMTTALQSKTTHAILSL